MAGTDDTGELAAYREFAVGGLYEDCAYHPVRCLRIRAEGDDVVVEGVSLVDGSQPRSCSVAHCGPVPLDEATAAEACRDFAAYRARRAAESGTPDA